MTEDRMALIEAIQKADDGNFLRALAQTVLQIIMDADVEALIGAGRHERSDGRLTYRNGYRDRTWRRGSARSTCASRSCARDRTFPAFWSRAGRWRRRWYRSSRKPGSAASLLAGSTTWCRRWA